MVTIDSNNTTYDAVSTTVAAAQTNRDMKANETALFRNVDRARFLRLTTDQTITIRFNSTTMPGISMTSTESPRTWKRTDESLEITNIYITNASGSTANIKAELYL